MPIFYNFYILLATFYTIFGTNILIQCPVPVPVCCMFFVSQEINIKRSPNAMKLFVDFFGPEDIQWAREASGGCPEGGTTHLGAPGGPGAPWWVVPTSGAPWTASLLYKYPNIPETLGESTKYSSSRRRVQNHQIQSRHQLGGVHHVHWCLSDDAWVVLCRPSGP